MGEGEAEQKATTMKMTGVHARTTGLEAGRAAEGDLRRRMKRQRRQRQRRQRGGAAGAAEAAGVADSGEDAVAAWRGVEVHRRSSWRRAVTCGRVWRAA